ncbi:MAG: RDD family protein [Candidatus Hodarchaeota archaeon]
MAKQQALDPIDSYIKEISALLPYPEKDKTPVLEELRRDVQDAMGTDKRPPSVVFGSVHDVAKNLSIAQDWATKPARWSTRTLAFIIDYCLILGIALVVALLRLIVADLSIEDIKLYHDTGIPFDFFFIVIPFVIFILSYFILLEKTFSTTLGKRLLKLMVVDESGISINWTQAVLRNFTKVPTFIGGFLPFDVVIGIFSEKSRGRNQRMLDFVAGTIVIQKTRKISKQGV